MYRNRAEREETMYIWPFFDEEGVGTAGGELKHIMGGNFVGTKMII